MTRAYVAAPVPARRVRTDANRRIAMKLLAIVIALALEQWRSFAWRASVEHAFVAYARALERRLNGGTSQQGVVAAVLAIGPPVVAVAFLGWALAWLHPFLALVFDVLVLYALMGFRRFSHAVSAIITALKSGDPAGARRALGTWYGPLPADLSSQDVARLSIERGLTDSYRQVFAVLFWFVVLPGPAGAVLYRATALLASEWKGALPGDDMTVLTRSLALFGQPARALLSILDWIPARLTALSFAVVGDFEDAAFCWRTQASTWPAAYGGEAIGVVLASGAGALGVQLGGPHPDVDGALEPRPELGIGDAVEAEVLPSAVGLVWRALVLWLLLVLLLLLSLG